MTVIGPLVKIDLAVGGKMKANDNAQGEIGAPR